MPDTANIFSTFPSPHLSLVGGAGDQVLATALLAISVCSARQVTDLPAVVGLTVLGLGVSLGYNCGYPLNPARDLGPRIFMCKILVTDIWPHIYFSRDLQSDKPTTNN